MSGNKLFRGTYTALVTPFENNRVDFESLKKVVLQQLDGGIDGFIVNGTTGESPTLKAGEVKEIFDFVRDLTGDEHQIILGVGTNNTETTIEWIKRANEWKVDGALAVVPYYNKPPQRGLVKHFEAVADQSQVPVILYNVPGRTIQTLSVESIEKLSRHEMIKGIKESTGDMDFFSKVRDVVPKDFSLLSGDDGTAVDFCLQGGDGLIGVVTHVIPRKMSEFISAARAGKEAAKTEFQEYNRLIEDIYLEANPIPVKMALHLMGLTKTPELRSPLVEMSRENKERLHKCLQALQLI